METEDRIGDERRKETLKGTGRPPPIIVTTNINLIKVQNEIKIKPKGDFAFRSTRNGFRISTKTMEDYLILKNISTEIKHTITPSTQKQRNR